MSSLFSASRNSAVLKLSLSLLFFALFLPGIWPGFAGAEENKTPKDSAVQVNGENISLEDVAKRFAYQFPDETRKVIEILALEKIVEQERSRNKIQVPQDMIEARFNDSVKAIEDKLKEEMPGISLKQYVEMSYQGKRKYEDFLDEVRVSVYRQVVMEYCMGFETLEKGEKTVQVLMVEDKDLAKELRERISKNEEFGALAKKHSTDKATANAGGLLGTFMLDYLARYEQYAFAIPFLKDMNKEGEVSEVIPCPSGFALLRVTNILQPETGLSADKALAKVKDMVEKHKFNNVVVNLWMEVALGRAKIDVILKPSTIYEIPDNMIKKPEEPKKDPEDPKKPKDPQRDPNEEKIPKDGK